MNEWLRSNAGVAWVPRSWFNSVPCCLLAVFFKICFILFSLSLKAIVFSLCSSLLFVFVVRNKQYFLRKVSCVECSCCSVDQSCPTLTPWTAAHQASRPSPHGVCPSSCSLHRWCCPTISSSDAFSSFCPQSFPESGTFPMNRLFASDDQNTGTLASASVLPVNIQGWFSFRIDWLPALSVSKSWCNVLV